MEQLKGMKACSLAYKPLRLKLCLCTHRVTHTCIFVCGHWPAVCKLSRLRFIGLGHSDHAPGQAIDLCTLRVSRLRPFSTHRKAAQGATAEEVFSRKYSDLLQHFANGVECKSPNELHENDGIAL
jgi:hypothetical protein